MICMDLPNPSTCNADGTMAFTMFAFNCEHSSSQGTAVFTFTSMATCPDANTCPSLTTATAATVGTAGTGGTAGTAGTAAAVTVGTAGTAGTGATGTTTAAATTTGPTPPGGEACGDGILDPGEECDDNNTMNGDGCDENCTIEHFEQEFPCGDDCLNGTIVSVAVPVVHPDRITYIFNNSGMATCNVSHFILFDIPECTNVVNVTGDPPGCVEGFDLPCEGENNNPHNDCESHIGPCRDDFAEFSVRPLKVDISGNECSVTVIFEDNMTFVEAPYGLKGGQDCSNCTVLVPQDCYAAPEVTPHFACSWDFGNGTCLASYNYTVIDGGVVIIAKGPTNMLTPMALPGTDFTPHIFTVPGQPVGRTAQWNCSGAGSPWLLWYLDGEKANATLGVPQTCDDCNNNSVPDPFDIQVGTSQDCNNNCVPDECDIASGASEDNNTNSIPDECETLDNVAVPPTNDESKDHSGLPGFIIVGIMLGICVIALLVVTFRDWGRPGSTPIWVGQRYKSKGSSRRRRPVGGNAAPTAPETAPLTMSRAPAASLSVGQQVDTSGYATERSMGGHAKPS